ncbi:Rhs element Vgr protein [Pseudomonas sp. M47T1]|nr:type VI secretion system tip protein TssI/VgrG [Pseudomonas sp. M47T1]EIK97138.1 Rhs element Vgr protein [Pseudomonas sp. M47T1]
MFAPANAAAFTFEIHGIGHDFQVLAFDGHEGLSQLFAINLVLVSENPDIDIQPLLQRTASLVFGPGEELINGIIDNIRIGGSGNRLTRYSLTLKPRLHRLQHRRNNRIFQQRTVPEIITLVLKDHWILADAFRFHIEPAPAERRDYVVQFDESDYDFITRLCAEESISFHFQHSRDEHLLVFSDNQAFFPFLPATPYQQDSGMVADQPVIRDFSVGFATRPTLVSQRDYNLRNPNHRLHTQSDRPQGVDLEVYRYPGLYTGEEHGKRLTRQARERQGVEVQVAEGHGDQPNLRSGHLLLLESHPRINCNARWLLLEVHHAGKQPQVLEESTPEADAGRDDFTQGYRNRFRAIPELTPYRPPLPAPRSPLVAQTAVVTGPEGEEIFTDDLGRVKVKFQWDRAAHSGEHSSCWVRVASSWAGAQFGVTTLPRIGMEVIVSFMDGLAERPLITGAVINSRNLAPYPLPANKSKTVLRSHSTPHTGGYNELSLEDRAGQEKVYLRAQKDLQQDVLNDSLINIGNDRREQIANDSFTLVSGAESRTTAGNRTTVLEADDLTSVSGNSYTQAAKVLVVEAGTHLHIKSGAKLSVEAGAEFSVFAGGHHLVINGGGIFSSVPIVQGGAPLPGLARPGSSALAAIPLTPAQLALMTLTRQSAADFCPLCEACRDGLCNLKESA